jgi:ribose transport system substrate-binding protein
VSTPALFTRARLTAAAAAALLLTLTACGTVGDDKSSSASSGGNKSITLAGVAFNAGDPFFATLMCSASKEANKLGVDLTWKAGQAASSQDQQTSMDAALLLKPDGLLLAAFQPGQFSAKVKQLMDGGTPVLTYNELQPSTSYQIVQSNRDVTEFVKYVSQGIGTTGTVGILGGSPGIPILESRWKPVVEELAKTAPGVKVLNTQYDDFDRSKASQIVSGWITSNPDLKAVYASSGPEGDGAAAAVQQAGKAGQVKVYTFDATPAVVAAVKSGAITAASAQSPTQIGAKSVDNIVDYLKGHPQGGPVAPTQQDLIPTMTLTKDNIDSPEAAGYLYKTGCDA